MAISSGFPFTSITLPLSPSFLLQSSPLKILPLPSPTFFTQSRARKVYEESYRLRNFYLSRLRYQFSRRHYFDGDDEDGQFSFDAAVFLFNNSDYHRCHDFLEALWNKAEEPRRTLIHGILQCAVGFHHLFNRNHRGAMMELGEGLCKLRKMNFESGPFHQFEQEIAAVLNFIYQTQMELAACSEDFCLTMDGSERSYQLLGGFASGKHLYHLENDQNDVLYIVFNPEESYIDKEAVKVKVPTLHATEEHLMACTYS
ncbi:uncharacterized protein LOC122061255 [Macadamia integrifolia]|uniref:uncharacterized protein LOC122061255 n=1 Tax=Macadamia integrifolia TaxID=60698 RepID=UPI001C52795B|nr:uncharacterized protein LOC122061255 [Macadamia integrifolia]